MPHKKGHTWGDLKNEAGDKINKGKKWVKKKGSEALTSFDKNVENLKILRGTRLHSDSYKRNTKRKVEATKNSPAGKLRTSSGKKVFSDKERGKLIRRHELFKSDPKAHAKAKAEHNKREDAKRKKVATDRHKTFKEDRKVKDKGQKSYNKGRDKKDHVGSAYERRQKDADTAMRNAAKKRHDAWKAARAEKKKNKKK